MIGLPSNHTNSTMDSKSDFRNESDNLALKIAIIITVLAIFLHIINILRLVFTEMYSHLVVSDTPEAEVEGQVMQTYSTGNNHETRCSSGRRDESGSSGNFPPDVVVMTTEFRNEENMSEPSGTIRSASSVASVKGLSFNDENMILYSYSSSSYPSDWNVGKWMDNDFKDIAYEDTSSSSDHYGGLWMKIDFKAPSFGASSSSDQIKQATPVYVFKA